MIISFIQDLYFDLKREGLVINIVIARGCSEIVYKRVEKVKKSIKILISILKS